jgi:ribosomal protein L37AE/L43A
MLLSKTELDELEKTTQARARHSREGPYATEVLKLIKDLREEREVRKELTSWFGAAGLCLKCDGRKVIAIAFGVFPCEACKGIGLSPTARKTFEASIELERRIPDSEEDGGSHVGHNSQDQEGSTVDSDSSIDSED